MADSVLSPAEAELLSGRGGDMLTSGGAFFWIFALLILAGGNFGFGANNHGDYVTSSELANQLNSQSTQNQLQQLGMQTADNNYQTSLLIQNQTNQMLQQNNTNLINAVQGFNTVNQNLTAGFAALAQQMCQLGYQMDQCCCKIQTQMLQNRLDDANAARVAAENNISNYNQSQYILSQLGKFVANAPAAAA